MNISLDQFLLFLGDLKDELDKEKESQTSIKRKIEEETKTTGNYIFIYKCVDCICAALVSVEMSWKQNQY